MRHIPAALLLTLLVSAPVSAEPITWVFNGHVTTFPAGGTLDEAFDPGTPFVLTLTADMEVLSQPTTGFGHLNAVSWEMKMGDYAFHSIEATFGLFHAATQTLTVDGSISNNFTVAGDVLAHPDVLEPRGARTDGPPFPVVLAPAFHDFTLRLPNGDGPPMGTSTIALYFMLIDQYGRWEDLRDYQENLRGVVTSVERAPVPAPASLLIMALGLAVFGKRRPGQRFALSATAAVRSRRVFH
jgi:hypothetical protein